MLSGEELWVQFFSGPGAGSDLASVRTRARCESGRWFLSGSKVWTSGARDADYGMCLARTNWAAAKHRGLTWFAVPTSAPGVSIRPIRENQRGSAFCEEFFDDVELTDDDVIGEVDRGWTVCRSMLLYERLGGEPSRTKSDVGPRALAPDLVELAWRAGVERDPVVRQLIARGHTYDFVREKVREWVEAATDSGRNVADLAAYSKLAEGTYVPLRARLALEISGSNGVSWRDSDPASAAVATNYLNGRIFSIAGGTNEMQRNVIGERNLGLPRGARRRY